ncbi:MAG: DUF2179 domain-containing protein [bacterium]|jgi:uncharacterized protein YebE (UPF0316 family)
MEYAVGFVFIFLARLVDVSMMTIRTLLVVRGKRVTAALIGFVEIIIYIVALGEVFKNLDNWLNILAYATGFAVGNYVGSYIEEKMAMGFLNVQVISTKCPDGLTGKLREDGFGVTVVEGKGRVGVRKILYIIAKRKEFPALMDKILTSDPDAFVTALDARSIRGGFIGHKDK